MPPVTSRQAGTLASEVYRMRTRNVVSPIETHHQHRATRDTPIRVPRRRHGESANGRAHGIAAHRGRRDGAFVGPQCESRGQQGGRRRLVRRMELREVGSAFHRSDDRTISRLYGVDERPAQCPTRALQPPKMCRVSAPLNVTVVPFRARQLSQALDPADIRTARRVPDPEHRVAGPSARRARLPRTNSATVRRTTYPWRAPDRLTSS